jgi:alpha-L-fucosidase
MPAELQAQRDAMNAGKRQRGVFTKFNHDKLGMFIHWGLYSIPSGRWNGREVWGMGEWIMWHANIPRAEYAALATQLNPDKFNAAEWIGLAKLAGMKYVVVTAKHHDGFALWPSKCSHFNIAEASPCKIPILDELYAECQKQGLGFGLYYSHVIDWRDGWEGEGGFPGTDLTQRDRTKSNPMNTWDPPNVTRQDYFNKKAYPQVRELLERYPNLYSMWFDYWYEGKYLNPPEAFKFYQLVHDLQPNCLVNSRLDGHQDANTIGDYITAGDDMLLEPGQKMPWETPGTLNNTWGYSARCTDWKSETELIYTLVNIISRGGNYLLNIGPRPDGSIPAETTACFQHIANWMRVNGEAVYGSTMWEVDKEGDFTGKFEGTVARDEQGFRADFTSRDIWFTARGKTVYVIGLVWPENGRVLIKSLAGKTVKAVALLGSNQLVQWTLAADGLRVSLPAVELGTIGFVLEIT